MGSCQSNPQGEESQAPVYAVCQLESHQTKEVFATVWLKESGGVTKIKAQFKGLPRGKHGFHIHEFGNLTEGCKSAGAHYNPQGVEHGGPKMVVRHVGDLGNVESTSNDPKEVTQFYLEDKLVRLTGNNSVIGRSCVVHADEDDLGLAGHADSKITGHAGARLGCGVIGLSGPFEI